MENVKKKTNVENRKEKLLIEGSILADLRDIRDNGAEIYPNFQNNTSLGKKHACAIFLPNCANLWDVDAQQLCNC